MYEYCEQAGKYFVISKRAERQSAMQMSNITNDGLTRSAQDALQLYMATAGVLTSVKCRPVSQSYLSRVRTSAVM